MEWSLDPEQIESFKKWNDEHKCRNGYAGAIGGRLTFTFTSTSLGEIAKVACNLCDEVHDMTDYDSW